VASAHRHRAALAARVGLAAARGARRVPEPVLRAGAALAADLAWAARGPRVRQLEATLARARPGAGARELRALSRTGLRAYARCWADVATLADWSPQRVADTVVADGVGSLRAALAQGRGAVLACGHLGSWDHLGAWVAQQVAPVTTVAERLEPPEVFAAFVALRRRLGVTALPLTGGGAPAALLRAVRAGGLVALLADRDLTGTGVGVQLLGEPARAAAGPAALALATGAPLFPLTCSSRRLPAGAPARWGLHVQVHPAVAVPAREPAGGRPAQVAAMTQAVADVLSSTVREHPADWHVLQPVFDADREPVPR